MMTMNKARGLTSNQMSGLHWRLRYKGKRYKIAFNEVGVAKLRSIRRFNSKGKYAKRKYPYSDWDGDGKVNKYDCRPYNKYRQDEDDDVYTQSEKDDFYSDMMDELNEEDKELWGEYNKTEDYKISDKDWAEEKIAGIFSDIDDKSEIGTINRSYDKKIKKKIREYQFFMENGQPNKAEMVSNKIAQLKKNHLKDLKTAKIARMYKQNLREGLAWDKTEKIMADIENFYNMQDDIIADAASRAARNDRLMKKKYNNYKPSSKVPDDYYRIGPYYQKREYELLGRGPSLDDIEQLSGKDLTEAKKKLAMFYTDIDKLDPNEKLSHIDFNNKDNNMLRLLLKVKQDKDLNSAFSRLSKRLHPPLSNLYGNQNLGHIRKKSGNIDTKLEWEEKRKMMTELQKREFLSDKSDSVPLRFGTLGRVSGVRPRQASLSYLTNKMKEAIEKKEHDKKIEKTVDNLIGDIGK